MAKPTSVFNNRGTYVAPQQGSSQNDIVTMGLDLSLTATGLVVARVEPTTFASVLRARHVRTSLPGKQKVPRRGAHNGVFYGDDEDRKDLIVKKVRSAVKEYLPVLVAIEGWSMMSKGGKSFTRYELAGAVKHELNMLEVPWIVYSPKSLKKFATGHGDAEKKEMINTAIGFGYHNIPDGNDDLADAYHLARYAAYFVTLLDPEQRFASV